MPTTPTDPTLAAHLDAIHAARDRENMQPTIVAFIAVLEEHPDDARVLYEVGGAYDTAGDELAACGYYERALARGLEGDVLRRCSCQYGSTLRNLGELERSAEVFANARAAYPDSPSLATFEALTLHAQGRLHETVAALLDVIADHVHSPDIDRYKASIRGNADYVRGLESSRDA
ncbi:tetratricopeptide repeat protein [Frondihabitans australicus]|uniref:Tetratricopeptide repeat protein n=1 Tax=Frondihabitans australicus TaxID=386892 RepID=A0A495IC16_9MICO|nr:tetratricopeptide repeat protein [Frondihabitans australicus]RKR73543.1 tetratricopeptide repeat protein [Frondihabitans australicus]